MLPGRDEHRIFTLEHVERLGRIVVYVEWRPEPRRLVLRLQQAERFTGVAAVGGARNHHKRIGHGEMLRFIRMLRNLIPWFKRSVNSAPMEPLWTFG